MSTMQQKEQRLYHADTVLTTYGLGYGGFGVDMIGDALTTDVFTFAYDEESDDWQVIAWTGSWPFAVDHPQGNFSTIEDAARFAKWLLARELFYQERDEAMMLEEPLEITFNN
jgi:hypothetical protein